MPVTDEQDFRPWLLYTSTTDSMIPWDWLEKSRDSAPPYLTEWDRTEMLLSAVNGDALPVGEWSRMCGATLNNQALSVSSPTQAHDLRKFWNKHGQRDVFGKTTNWGVGNSSSSWEDQPVPLMDQARAPLRAALEAIIKEPETAASEIAKNAAAITDGRVIRVPELSEHGTIRDRVIAHSIGAALVFALGLVLDQDRPFRRRLRQCALPTPECGRFALVAPPETRGQPPNFYCSDEHRLAHRRIQSRERVAASRAGVPVAKYRQRKARGRK